MKVTDVKCNKTMLYNLSLCKACLQRLVRTNKFVRFRSHYAVLGITNNATQKEVRDAYIKLSKKFHPDQNRDDTKSHEKFVKINEAYEVLSKDTSRQTYDDSLRVRNQPGKDFGTYGARPRPQNYYSSGQFYEDQGPFNQYNPYSKRQSNQHYDPFSSYGYEQHQRQSNSFNEDNRQYIGALRYTILLLFLPYLLLRVFLWHKITSQETFGKQEIERRKHLKEQKAGDYRKSYTSKATSGRDSS